MTNEMTAEEAVKILRFEQEQVEHRLDGCSDTQENRNIYEAFSMAMKALEQQSKPMEKFDDVKTHIQRLAGDYKCWDNRLTWEEALELNRMLEAQPNSNEFFNFDAPMVKKSDAVSRSELQKTMDSLTVFSFVNNGHEEAEDYYNCESVDMVIRNLPSVTPQRAKGKWVEIEIDAGEFIYKCTKCGMRVINPYKYCPICGAEMNGGGDDEVSD